MEITSASQSYSMRTMPILDDDFFWMRPSDMIGWDIRVTQGVKYGQKVLGEPVSDYY